MTRDAKKGKRDKLKEEGRLDKNVKIKQMKTRREIIENGRGGEGTGKRI